MSDPIAQAAQQIQQQVNQEPAPAVAQPADAPTSQSTNGSNEPAQPDSPKPVEPVASATAVSESAPPALAASTGAETGEHPHTSILRKMVGLIRRDFNMLSGELESWVAEAEKHL